MCTEYLHWTRHGAGHWRPGDDNSNSKHSCHTCSVLATPLSALSARKRLNREVCSKGGLVLSQLSGEGGGQRGWVPRGPDDELSLQGCVGLTWVLQAEGLRGHRVD